MNKPFCRCLYRPTPQPAANLPFGLRSVGHYRVPPGYHDNPAVKDFVQVFWCVSGTGRLVIDGTERQLRPRQIAVYLPGMYHDVGALDQTWEYFWWTMDGPLATSVTTSFGLIADIYHAGPAPRHLFARLERTIRSQSQAAERQASAIAYQLLTLAVSGSRTSDEDHRVNEALRIIHRDWNHTEMCVKQLADHLHVHRSSLSRRFDKAVGIPPETYLMRLRVQNALSLLKHTRLPIFEVARRCGYQDPNYFSRLMRRFTGQSPSSIRHGSVSDGRGRKVRMKK